MILYGSNRFTHPVLERIKVVVRSDHAQLLQRPGRRAGAEQRDADHAVSPSLRGVVRGHVGHAAQQVVAREGRVARRRVGERHVHAHQPPRSAEAGLIRKNLSG